MALPAPPTMALPASETKHLPVLQHPLPPPHAPLQIHQNSLPTTATTGSTLWLSSQLLTTHLLRVLPSPPRHRLRILELGAGCGLTSLALAAAGHAVLATDLPCVLDTVLERNVRANMPRSAGVVVAGLDWCADDGGVVRRVGWGGVDVVVTADTVYVRELVRPLVETVARYAGRRTEVWVGLERREEEVVEEALEVFRERGFRGGRVKVGEGAWEGVEVWRWRWGVGAWKREVERRRAAGEGVGEKGEEGA